MTFDEFKEDFMKFLETSTVNLGRRTTKTRQAFLYEAAAKMDAFVAAEEQIVEDAKSEKTTVALNPMHGSVMRIQPKDARRALDVGKGVHAMTASESARADEQLNRSPFAGKTGEKGQDDGNN